MGNKKTKKNLRKIFLIFILVFSFLASTSNYAQAADNTSFTFVVVSDVHQGQELTPQGWTNLQNSIKSYNPNYLIINGDLYMVGGSICGKGTGDSCSTAACQQCYDDYYAKFNGLASKIFVTPGNHDQKTALKYFKNGLVEATGGAALITLNDFSGSSTFDLDLTPYNKVFLFAHYPIIGHSNYKSGLTKTGLNPSFQQKLAKLNGSCAFIAGHNHIYDVNLTDPTTKCLSVEDGVAGGDHGDNRIDSTGIKQLYNSYTLVQVSQNGFKVCAVKQPPNDKGGNFTLDQSSCKDIGSPQISNTPSTSTTPETPGGLTTQTPSGPIQLQIPILGVTEVPNLCTYIKAVYQAGTYIVVPIVIVIIILGGIEWLGAAGRDPEGITKAKSRIWHGLIGLAIMLLSYLLLSLVGITGLNCPNLEYIGGMGAPSGGGGGGPAGSCTPGSLANIPPSALTYNNGHMLIDPNLLDVKLMSAKTIIQDLGGQSCPTTTKYSGNTAGGCYGNIVDLMKQFPQLPILAATNAGFFENPGSDKAQTSMSADEKQLWISHGRPDGGSIENGVFIKGAMGKFNTVFAVIDGKPNVSYNPTISTATMSSAVVGCGKGCNSMGPALCVTKDNKVLLTIGRSMSTPVECASDVIFFDGGGSIQYYYNFNGEKHEDPGTDLKKVGQGRNVANFIVVTPKTTCTPQPTTPTGTCSGDLYSKIMPNTIPPNTAFIDPKYFDNTVVCVPDATGEQNVCAAAFGFQNACGDTIKPCLIKSNAIEGIKRARAEVKKELGNDYEILIMSSLRTPEYQRCLKTKAPNCSTSSVCGTRTGSCPRSWTEFSQAQIPELKAYVQTLSGAVNVSSCPHVTSRAIDLCVYNTKTDPLTPLKNGKAFYWNDTWKDCENGVGGSKIQNCSCRYAGSITQYLLGTGGRKPALATSDEAKLMQKEVMGLRKAMKAAGWKTTVDPNYEWWHYNWESNAGLDLDPLR